MYTRQQASQLRQEFWTVFGQYMSPVLSADGEKINWINYKTGEKHLLIRLETDNRSATISIEITHPDEGIRQIYYEQMLELQKTLHTILGEEWVWEPAIYTDSGNTVSKIYTQLQGKSVLNKADWPELISFFKPRMIALDMFWSNARYAFELLR